MATTFTNTPKNATAYSTTAKPGITPGTIFYAWMFWFTIPGGAAFSKLAKNTTAFTSIAKP